MIRKPSDFTNTFIKPILFNLKTQNINNKQITLILNSKIVIITNKRHKRSKSFSNLYSMYNTTRNQITNIQNISRNSIQMICFFNKNQFSIQKFVTHERVCIDIWDFKNKNLFIIRNSKNFIVFIVNHNSFDSLTVILKRDFFLPSVQISYFYQMVVAGRYKKFFVF